MTTPTERDRVTAAKIRLYAHYQGLAGGEGVTYRSWDDVREDIAIALAAARAEGYAQGSDVAAQYTTSAALQNSVVDRLAEAEQEAARLTEVVRAWAIWRAAYEHADEYRCRLCRTSWIMGRETEVHAPDCPAVPVGAAPMEDARP